MRIKLKAIFLLIGLLFLAACGDEPKEREWDWVIEPGKYEDIYFVGEDRIAIQDQNGKYAIGNLQGKPVTSFQYDSIAPYFEGLAAVRSGNSCYYIDREGVSVIEDIFQGAGNFSEGIAAVKIHDLWGFISVSGEQIVPCIYQEVRSFHNERGGVRGNKGWGFVDEEGRVVIPEQYEEIKIFKEERAAVKRDGKWGFIDPDGNGVGELVYEEVKSFCEGRAAVKRENKWGFIDLQGDLCIECCYDEVGCFSEGKAAVKREAFQEGCDAWAYVDREGQVIIDFYLYDAAGSEPFWIGEFHDGIAFVTKTIGCIIDSEGKDVFQNSIFFISEPLYNKEYDMMPGYIFTDPNMTIRKYGMVGLNGEQRIEPVFDGIDSMQGRYIIVLESTGGKVQKGMIAVK